MAKRQLRSLKFRSSLFLLVVIASLIGNALGYWFFHHNYSLPEDFAGTVQNKLNHLEKMHRDLQHRNIQVDQASREKQSLEEGLEFHRHIMEKSRQSGPGP